MLHSPEKALWGGREQARGELAFPKSSFKKKAMSILPSLPQPMRSLILSIAKHNAL